MIGFWYYENLYTPAPYSTSADDRKRTEVPTYLLPGSSTGEIVAHDHFMLSYNETYEQAEWVAYLLLKRHLTYDDRKRPYFVEDPKVRTKSADWRNYKGSGFDRGHLCPAGDRRFSEYAYNETFYTSNISPQDRDFNAGVWNRLERKIRQWAKKYTSVFVVTGGVLKDGLQEIGEERVDVPDYYYKIVAKGSKENIEVVAFLIPNRESSMPLQQFVVEVDTIEKMTGLDFFKNLQKQKQLDIEGSVALEDWDF